MTDRPILCATSVARAIWEGRQTQDRRPIKKKAALDALAVFAPEFLSLPGNADLLQFAVGDRLWVREAHAVVGTCDPGWVLYRASGYEAECARHGFDNPPPESDLRWKPSLHMPRWASRMTLLVTDVRVQRLQDISEEDAQAEGLEFLEAYGLWCDPISSTGSATARSAFASLWNSLYAARPGLSWADNPWVAATTFTTVRKTSTRWRDR